MCIYVFVSMHAYGGQRSALSVVSQEALYLCRGGQFSDWLRALHISWADWTVRLRDLPAQHIHNCTLD